MRLLEFQASSVKVAEMAASLRRHFKMEQVGGPSRVYRVGSLSAAAFLLDGGPKGVGLAWQEGSPDLARVYVWNRFNVAHSPDFVADLPSGLPDAIMEAVVAFITHPHAGPYPIAAPIVTEASEPVEFVLMGRNARGELFEIEGMDQYAKALGAAAARHKTGGGDATASMDEQYAKLREKVELVALNKSSYIKALLITGAPSSGKTFTVMETIKRLGLKAGTDYTVIKGSPTEAAVYQTLIENIDGLTIFDDSDSVVGSVDGKNLMKNALDTYAVRDCYWPKKNTTNTNVMPDDERIAFVDAVSRILRGTATTEDLKRFEPLGKKTGKEAKDYIPKVDKDGKFIIDDPEDFLASLMVSNRGDRLRELQEYFSRHMPNKIDFRGRIIFISNMEEDQWDRAILTRAFRQNMSFPSNEMIDYIEKIKDHIEAPNLTSEQKEEVLAWIRVLHDNDSLKSPINFRLVQQAFDLRLCANWHEMIADL